MKGLKDQWVSRVSRVKKATPVILVLWVRLVFRVQQGPRVILVNRVSKVFPDLRVTPVLQALKGRKVIPARVSKDLREIKESRESKGHKDQWVWKGQRVQEEISDLKDFRGPKDRRVSRV